MTLVVTCELSEDGQSELTNREIDEPHDTIVAKLKAAGWIVDTESARPDVATALINRAKPGSCIAVSVAP